MKFLTNSLILPLLVAVLAGVFLFNYQTDKPDVRYNLSQRLPTSFNENNIAESLQLLEIKNIGKAEANAIIVKSSKKILKYEIQKYLKSDKPEVSDSNAFELKYASLPPEGSFKVILKSDGNGLVNTDLTIVHSKGLGSDVFSNNKGWIYVIIFWSGFAFGLLFFIMSVKDYSTQQWESKSSYRIEEVLKSKKPFYINSVKWDEIKNTAYEQNLENKIPSYNQMLNISAAYKFLNAPKPNDIDSETFLKLSDKASQLMVDIYNKAIRRSYTIDELMLIIDIPCPVNMAQNVWSEICGSIRDRYFELLFIKVKRINNNSFADILNNPIPAIIDNNKYKEVIIDAYIDNIYRNLYRSQDTLKYLNDLNLDIIDGDTRDSLQKRAYYLKLADIYKWCFNSSEPLKYVNDNNYDYLADDDIKLLIKIAHQKEIANLMPVIDVKSAQQLLKIDKPVLLAEYYTNKLYTLAKDIIEFDANYNKNIKIMDILNSIISGIDITADRPSNITESEWNDIIRLSDSIYREKRKASLLTKKVESRKILLDNAINRVKSQLSTINTFLSDPSVVNRIESYEHLFAKGNLENLTILNKLLVDNKVI
ncbi:MAG: hypothetical protein ACD_20C00433G0007 [uncultured bacterium]|nr:MAG: hypothetical protein ACD_20C00433G0007 [uncultured bacterium]